VLLRRLHGAQAQQQSARYSLNKIKANRDYRTDMTLGQKSINSRLAQILKTNRQNCPISQVTKKSVDLVRIYYLSILAGKKAYKVRYLDFAQIFK
jgi:hypothetical protein